MPNRAKYRRLTELFVRGSTVLLPNGDPLYVRTLNPFERDEAVHDASVTRSRVTLAIKEIGSPDADRARGEFWQNGRDAAIDVLAKYDRNSKLLKSVEAVRDDPDWKERVEIMERSEDLGKATEEEQQLAQQISDEYYAEVAQRFEEMVDDDRRRLQALSDAEIIEEYMNAWSTVVGTERANREYAVTELFYAVRACDGVLAEGGNADNEQDWDHAACDGHRVQLFESKDEIRELPEDLRAVLANALTRTALTVRDARFSDRPASSSVSSPQQNAPEESTVSTPTETRVSVPGI